MMTSTEVVEFSILIKSLVSRLFTYYSVVTERCNRTLSKEDFYKVAEFSVLIDSLKTELVLIIQWLKVYIIPYILKSATIFCIIAIYLNVLVCDVA